MSIQGDIVDAILADIATAVSGVTAEREAASIDERLDSDFPLAQVMQIDSDVDALPYLQEARSWTISCAVWLAVPADGTSARELMETTLEAIQAQVFADPTLGAVVDRAVMISSVPDSHPDDSRIGGLLVVRAEKVF